MFGALPSKLPFGQSLANFFSHPKSVTFIALAALITTYFATLTQPLTNLHGIKQATAAISASTVSALNSTPIYFETNRGQWGPSIRYAARGQRYTIAFGAQEAVIRANNSKATAALRFRGGNTAPAQKAEKIIGTLTTFHHGSDRSLWISGVDTYAKIKYSNIYPGIDVVFYGHQQELEYDFIIAPGADPSRIALEFRNTDSINITFDGGLAIGFNGDTIKQKAPVIYQDIAGQRSFVKGQYIVRDDQAIGFQLDEFDPKAPLYISPSAS